MSKDKLGDFLVGTTAPPALALNDPDYKEKLAKWQRDMARDEYLRQLTNLRKFGGWE